MMKRKKVWIAIGVAAASLAVWAFVRRDAANAETYRFVTVERGTIESVVASTGAIEALETVEVGTQVSGQIAELFVDFNCRVGEGQLLARIDPTDSAELLERYTDDGLRYVAVAGCSRSFDDPASTTATPTFRRNHGGLRGYICGGHHRRGLRGQYHRHRLVCRRSRHRAPVLALRRRALRHALRVRLRALAAA